MKKRLALLALAPVFIVCHAQDRCQPGDLRAAAARVLALQAKIEPVSIEQGQNDVPATVTGRIAELKDALRRVSDAALACAPSSLSPLELQRQLSTVLHANVREPARTQAIAASQRQIAGLYGGELAVAVSRPPAAPRLLMVEYSIDIHCGTDTLLLMYEAQHGAWRQRLRWQSGPLKEISDPFGDFFLTAVLPARPSSWRIVVAHGTPWCVSRLSTFQIDVLAPAPDPAAPAVLWQTRRAYSRGAFDPRVKSSGDTFELRLNA